MNRSARDDAPWFPICTLGVDAECGAQELCARLGQTARRIQELGAQPAVVAAMQDVCGMVERMLPNVNA